MQEVATMTLSASWIIVLFVSGMMWFAGWFTVFHILRFVDPNIFRNAGQRIQDVKSLRAIAFKFKESDPETAKTLNEIAKRIEI